MDGILQKTFYKFEKGFKGCLKEFYIGNITEKDEMEEKNDSVKLKKLRKTSSKKGKNERNKIKKEIWRKVDLVGEATEGMNVVQCRQMGL